MPEGGVPKQSVELSTREAIVGNSGGYFLQNIFRETGYSLDDLLKTNYTHPTSRDSNTLYTQQDFFLNFIRSRLRPLVPSDQLKQTVVTAKSLLESTAAQYITGFGLAAINELSPPIEAALFTSIMGNFERFPIVNLKGETEIDALFEGMTSSLPAQVATSLLQNKIMRTSSIDDNSALKTAQRIVETTKKCAQALYRITHPTSPKLS